MRKLFLLAALLLVSPVFADDPADHAPTLYPTAEYQVTAVEGWTVRLSPALKGDEKLKAAGLAEIARQLQEISRLLPAKAVEKLRAVPIWVDTNGWGGAQYHPDKDWLTENGYNPDKARAVEIGRIAQFAHKPEPGRHRMTLLHELAHAYHDQVLTFDQPDVIKAYDAAVAGGKYESVLRDTGGMERHYGLTDHKEYFAEASEAYFAVNDYYPFIRAELKQFDPQIYGVLGKLWGESENTPTPAPPKPR